MIARSETNGVTPEQLALIVDLLPSIQSLRDLCSITGIRLDTMRRVTAPFLAIMKLAGTHPKCGCGKDRFHPYGCVDSWVKGAGARAMPGHKPARAAVLAERRSVILADLIDGERFCLIDRKLGLCPKSARNYVRFLTPEQLAQRERRLSERQATDRAELRRAA